MSEKHTQTDTDELQAAVRHARGFWEKHSRNIVKVSSAVILIIGAYLGYKYLYQQPREEKAMEEIYGAEELFRQDSLSLALNGTPTIPGFLKVIKKYPGTQTANIAHYYAGVCYLHLGDFKNAVTQLEEFDANGALQVEAKAHGLLGDAYSEQKQNDKAIKHYQKASSTFPEDQGLSSEYLFRAAMLQDISGDKKGAIESLKTLKEKFPRTEKGFQAEKHLARLGETD